MERNGRTYRVNSFLLSVLNSFLLFLLNINFQFFCGVAHLSSCIWVTYIYALSVSWLVCCITERFVLISFSCHQPTRILSCFCHVVLSLSRFCLFVSLCLLSHCVMLMSFICTSYKVESMILHGDGSCQQASFTGCLRLGGLKWNECLLILLILDNN